MSRTGADCKISTDLDCRFRPNMNAATGPTSSLMSMHFIPSVKDYIYLKIWLLFWKDFLFLKVNSFCDSTNHDRTAPNKQNYWCRNRSVKTVISRTVDYFSTPNTLPPTTSTAPAFNFFTPSPQAVYIVLDTSNHNSNTAVTQYI